MGIVLENEAPPTWTLGTPWSSDPKRKRLQGERRYFCGDSQKQVLVVLDTWEGIIESREAETVYVQLLKEEQELYFDFHVSDFELGGPVAIGCTFEARNLSDIKGQTRWRCYPHAPVVGHS